MYEHYCVGYGLTFNPTMCALLILGHTDIKIEDVRLTLFGRNTENVLGERNSQLLLKKLPTLISIIKY